VHEGGHARNWSVKVSASNVIVYMRPLWAFPH